MKTIRHFKTIVLLLLLATGLNANANDTLKVDLTVGADLVSHYIWRGLNLGNSPAIQPTMGITYGGLSFGSWASYSVNPSSFQEVDLYLSYTIGSFTFGVNDYYNPVDSMGVSDTYFNYGKSSTLHSLEPFITLSEIGGTGFSATAAFFAYGNDRDENNKNLYSSYLELSYSANVKDLGFTFFGGGTVNKGYYAGKPAVTNLGITISKEIKITDGFALPCKGSFIVNPNTQNVYFVFGFTF
jgi:hypothetical protein